MSKTVKFGVTILVFVRLSSGIFWKASHPVSPAKTRAASNLNTVIESGTFDKPIRKTVMDLGATSYERPSYAQRVVLTCFYYSNFMVKELDDRGQQGARWFSVTPIASGQAPSCEKSRGEREQLIAQNWSGYFKGVKQELVFLNGDDGYNSGYPFAVFDSRSGMELFEDSVTLTTKSPSVAPRMEACSLGILALSPLNARCPETALRVGTGTRQIWG